MGIINQLDYATANLVAAGEVIDRPASIVKELIENSIDAGATRITLEIKNGGISFIRVTDNGKGMAREDVPISILRHATSKLKTGADLNAIMTLGFRGEALASVAAVAKLRIRTKRPEDQIGTELSVEPGGEPVITEAGMSDGTTIIVEDLFESIPARRKFLKKDQTEANAVQAVFEKIALSCPHISMTLVVDNWKRIYTVGDGKLEHTIYGVLGSDFSGKLIEIASASDPSLDGTPRQNIKVHGFIGSPENARSNRNYQCFFVNGRFVRSKCLYASLEQAYTSYIASEKYPTCVVFVELPPSEVDVNVHPTKLEVKFANEKAVFETLYYTVRGALENSIPRPTLTVDKKNDPLRTLNAFVPIDDRSEKSEPKAVYNNQKNVKKGQISWADLVRRAESIEPTEKIEPVVRPRVAEPSKPAQPPIKSAPQAAQTQAQSPASKQLSPEQPTTSQNLYEAVAVSKPDDIPRENIQTNYWVELPKTLDDQLTARHEGKTVAPMPQQMVLEQVPSEIEAPKPDTAEYLLSSIEPEFRILGEAFLSYVFVEVGDKVMIIDKHAAHERIIFEELRENARFANTSTQILLVPMDITLSTEEISAIVDYEDDIRALGFDFTVSDLNKVSILAIPIGIEVSAVSDMIITIADRLYSGTGSAEISRDILFEKALYQASCKAAIKAGRDEDIEHIKWIIKKLLTLDDIKVCPHGRPVAFELTKQQIERQFRRT